MSISEIIYRKTFANRMTYRSPWLAVQTEHEIEWYTRFSIYTLFRLIVFMGHLLFRRVFPPTEHRRQLIRTKSVVKVITICGGGSGAGE